MADWIMALLIFIALLSGGYRMDEQFFPSERAWRWSFVKLRGPAKTFFCFRNRAVRRRFLRAAVIQQCAAYAYLLLSAGMLAFGADSTASHFSAWFLGGDLAFVLATGLLYKFYR